MDLAERHHPIGIEATAYTLEAIADCDPGWMSRLSEFIRDGKVEFVGSGYSQAIGPLLPADMVAANLRLGNQAYRELLGVARSWRWSMNRPIPPGWSGFIWTPAIEAILMDWDNVANHPEWKPEYRYAPQRALGSDGRDIALLWTNTSPSRNCSGWRMATSRWRLSGALCGPARVGDRALCLYASDAEIFDFRPGRFRTEETNQGGSEWQRIDEAFAGVDGKLDGVDGAPSADAQD